MPRVPCGRSWPARRGVPWRDQGRVGPRSVSTVVLNFCLERIPVLGCPTVLLRTTWGPRLRCEAESANAGNLRSILIIAAMYGRSLRL